VSSKRTTLTNEAGQAIRALNNTASENAAHSIPVEEAGLPVASTFGSKIILQYSV
jgi:hypothetical protein